MKILTLVIRSLCDVTWVTTFTTMMIQVADCGWLLLRLLPILPMLLQLVPALIRLIPISYSPITGQGKNILILTFVWILVLQTNLNVEFD